MRGKGRGREVSARGDVNLVVPVFRPFKRLGSALRLSPIEVGRAVEAAVLFHGFRLLLKVIPFRRFRRVLGPSGPVASSPERPVGRPSPSAIAISQALFRASKLYPDTCLPQTLAGRVMLRRRRLPSTLSLGTRHEEGKLTFHAWIATEGVILNVGGGPRHFATIATFYDPPFDSRPPRESDVGSVPQSSVLDLARLLRRGSSTSGRRGK